MTMVVLRSKKNRRNIDKGSARMVAKSKKKNTKSLKVRWVNEVRKIRRVGVLEIEMNGRVLKWLLSSNGWQTDQNDDTHI